MLPALRSGVFGLGLTFLGSGLAAALNGCGSDQLWCENADESCSCTYSVDAPNEGDKNACHAGHSSACLPSGWPLEDSNCTTLYYGCYQEGTQCDCRLIDDPGSALDQCSPPATEGVGTCCFDAHATSSPCQCIYASGVVCSGGAVEVATCTADLAATTQECAAGLAKSCSDPTKLKSAPATSSSSSSSAGGSGGSGGTSSQ